MAITNYTELQAAVADYMARNDVSGKATEFIALAEARLNRQIDSIASTITLNGVADQNYIDITALNIIEPVSLYVEGVIHEFSVTPKPQGSFPYFEIRPHRRSGALRRLSMAPTDIPTSASTGRLMCRTRSVSPIRAALRSPMRFRRTNF
jgi:hypothetical protein